VTLSCTTADQATALVAPAVERLTTAVGAVEGIEDEPLPPTLFDHVDRVPVISSGSWSDRQVVVDPTIGQRGLRAVPASLRAPGVEAYVEGRDTVVAFRDPASAATLLDRMLAESDQHLPEIVERAGTAADRTVCAEGYRPGESSACLSLVGRFVVAAEADQGKAPKIDEQLKLLREVR
jgi:hypothetical protein